MYRACLPLRSKLLMGAGGLHIYQCPNYPMDKTRHHISDRKGDNRFPPPLQPCFCWQLQASFAHPWLAPSCCHPGPPRPLQHSSQPAPGRVNESLFALAASLVAPVEPFLQLASAPRNGSPPPQLIFFSVSSTWASLRTHLQMCCPYFFLAALDEQCREPFLKEQDD